MAVEGCRSRSISITLITVSDNPVSWIQSSEDPPTGMPRLQLTSARAFIVHLHLSSHRPARTFHASQSPQLGAARWSPAMGTSAARR